MCNILTGLCRYFTCQPDGTASEASSGAHDLPSLAAADMVGLVHYVGGSVEVLKYRNTCLENMAYSA